MEGKEEVRARTKDLGNIVSKMIMKQQCTFDRVGEEEWAKVNDTIDGEIDGRGERMDTRYEYRVKRMGDGEEKMPE